VSPRAPARSRSQLLAAAGLLLASGWLRFSNLRPQGVFVGDEVYLAEHARGFAGFFRALWSGPRVFFAEVARTGGIWHVTAAKPTQYALMTLAALAGGGGDFPLLCVSAAFGLATVFLLYVWGRRESENVGLFAAALLGGLGGHLWYSRSLLAIAPASFFLTLGAYLCARDESPRPSTLFLSGLALGLAVTAHYNTLPPVALVVLFAAARRRGRDLPGLAAGLLLPLLGWELVFQLRNAATSHPLPSYWGELRMFLFETSRRGAGEAWAPGLLTRWLALSSGAPAVVLLGAGIASAAAGLRPRAAGFARELLVAALGPGMLLFWCVASLWWAQVARPAGNLLPFLCLWAAVGWGRWADSLARKTPALRGAAGPSAAVLLFAALLPAGLAHRATISPYRRLADFLGAQEKGGLATWNPTLVGFYADRGDFPALPPEAPPAALASARYLVADYMTPEPRLWPAALKERATPLALYVLPFSNFDARLGCLEGSPDPTACSRGELPFGDRVAVYALRPARR